MSSLLAPLRESVTGAAADASAGPARTMVITAALDDLSAPERMEVAKSALAGLSVAARLHVTGDALAVLGSDEAVRAARRGEAELILAQADAATSEHAVDRLGARLDEPARARLAGRLLEGLRHEVRETLVTAPSVQPADGGAVADGKTGQPEEAATGSGTLAALARAGQVIDGVADETLAGAVDDEELRWSVDRLVVLGRKVDAERLRRLDEITGRGSHGARSTADMVRERYGFTSGAAQREVEIARRLRRLPDTRRKLQEGSLDRSHAEQAGKALADVERAASRGALTEEQAGRAAEKVDRLAAGAGPSEDANGLARRLHDANVAGGALDLAERDRRAHAGRRL